MPLTESPSAALASYSFRRSAFDDEREYVLLPDRIEVRQGENVVRTLPLAAIRKVHLRFDPSETRTYYKCNIRADGGGLFLRHNSFQRLGRVEGRGAAYAYAVFVRALLMQLADQPGVRFRAGSPFNFILAITFIPLSLWGGWWALAKTPWCRCWGWGWPACTAGSSRATAPAASTRAILPGTCSPGDAAVVAFHRDESCGAKMRLKKSRRRGYNGTRSAFAAPSRTSRCGRERCGRGVRDEARAPD